MKKRFPKFLIALGVLVMIILAGLFLKKKPLDSYIQFDDTRTVEWTEGFKVVDIPSSADGNIQKSYFYKSKANEAKPLIVSLHTWSGDYAQIDAIAELSKEKDLNYIHPDFRGSNWTKNACCSDLVMSDIDDAISFAIKNSKVDTSKIYVIGVSGGGYATLSTFMRSKYHIKRFSAWASITDLTAWYEESKILGNKYADHILQCTGSTKTLNESVAKQKSPLYMETPTGKKSELFIFAGIYDGLQGSVPITHSINFYNKLLTDFKVTDQSKFVSNDEKLKLLEFRKPLSDLGKIADRKICLQKANDNIHLTIFEGNHEMLAQYAFEQLLKD